MELGLGHLRMRPADFWTMSLAEWRAAAAGYRESVTGEGEAAEDRMDRATLDELMKACPDG